MQKYKKTNTDAADGGDLSGAKIRNSPHTSGVRYCSCGPIATHPCRPTACTERATPPSVHCSLITDHCYN
ncbi:MAG: hypothetical protein IKU03_07875 [Bacteroidales bacterium]|nr:hypothetical protein [Bacteroidales bacterium]